MGKALPELSRLELQCLRCLGAQREGLIRQIQANLPHTASYSTIRKIFQRLEEKGAIARVRLEGRAWVYRSDVSAAAVIRREVRRLIDRLFDGNGASLVAQLADMDAVTLDDLWEIERRLASGSGRTDRPNRRRGRRSSRRQRRKQGLS